MSLRVRFYLFALASWFFILLIGASFIQAGKNPEPKERNSCEAPMVKPVPPAPQPVPVIHGFAPPTPAPVTTYYYPPTPKPSPTLSNPPQPSPPKCEPISNLQVHGKTLTWNGSPPFFVRYGVNKLNLNNAFTTSGTSYTSPGRYWFGIINLCSVKIIDP